MLPEELAYCNLVFNSWKDFFVSLKSFLKAKENWVVCSGEGIQCVLPSVHSCTLVSYLLSLKSLCGLVKGITDGSNIMFAVVAA